MMIANKKEKGWACLVTTQVIKKMPDKVSMSQKSLIIALDLNLACFDRMPSIFWIYHYHGPMNCLFLNEPEINQVSLENYFVLWSNSRSVVQKEQLL